MTHKISNIYIKLVGNHTRLPITPSNIQIIKESSLSTHIDVTIGSLLHDLPRNVHMTICFIPCKYIEEYSQYILQNIQLFSQVYNATFTKRCLSKFGRKLVIIYNINTTDNIFNDILTKCYPNYNPNSHHYHVSIPLKYDYDEYKYISINQNLLTSDYEFWKTYIKNLRFINSQLLNS